jgi:hypothetical protein
MANRQSNVEMPKTGMYAITTPNVIAKASEAGETPCFKNPTIGSINFFLITVLS